MVEQPCKLELPDISGMPLQQRAKFEEHNGIKFREFWAKCDTLFENAYDDKDLDKINEVWGQAAGAFLWWLCYASTPKPNNLPIRRNLLPVFMQNVASKACATTWICRSAFTNKVDDVKGLVADRIFRLNGKVGDARTRDIKVQLSDAHGSMEGTADQPTHYDSATGGKTCSRLYNAISSLGGQDATKQRLAENNPFEGAGHVPAELHLLKDVANGNTGKPTEGCTSIDLLSNCANQITAFGKKYQHIVSKHIERSAPQA